MGLSRTDFEVDGDLSRKSQIFPNRHVFCAPADGVPLDLCISVGVKKLE